MTCSTCRSSRDINLRGVKPVKAYWCVVWKATVYEDEWCSVEVQK